MVCFLMVQILPNFTTKVQATAEGERYLSGFDENITVDDSSYIAYDKAFFNEIKSNYSNSYNSEDTALEIDTAEKFAAFSEVVNSSSDYSFDKKYVKLTSDINLNGGGVTFKEESDGTNFKIKVAGMPQNRWKPIGKKEDIDSGNFKGIFDGQGHKVTNMLVFEKCGPYDYVRAGLFGIAHGTIKNVGIDNNSCVYSYSDVGGLVGKSCGNSIINCYSTASIYAPSASYSGGLIGNHFGYCDESLIRSCYATGNIYAYTTHGSEAGGLVGNSPSITDCYATGNVYACGGDFYTHAGGLAGTCSSITNCYATGNVSSFNSWGNIYAGGLIAAFCNDYSITSCYATGNVSSFNSSGCVQSGGLIASLNYSDFSITSCYATGNVYACAHKYSNAYVGGIVGNYWMNDYLHGDRRKQIKNCYYSNIATIQSNSNEINDIGTPTDLADLKGVVTNKISDFNSDDAWYFFPDKYPILKWQISPAFSEEDKETLVKVEAPAGVFPENSHLKVKKLSSKTFEYEKTFKGLDKNIKSMSEKNLLFEISIVDGSGNLVQPNTEYGLATVKIPIPEDFDKNDLQVYRIQYVFPDDSFNEHVIQENGRHYCRFQTDHFSPYALTDEIDETYDKTIIN